VKVEVFCFPLALLTGKVGHSTERPHSEEVGKGRKKERKKAASFPRSIFKSNKRRAGAEAAFQLSHVSSCM
jgi:hypothetical protein